MNSRFNIIDLMIPYPRLYDNYLSFIGNLQELNTCFHLGSSHCNLFSKRGKFSPSKIILLKLAPPKTTSDIAIIFRQHLFYPILFLEILQASAIVSEVSKVSSIAHFLPEA